jgi:hypothetical protein
VALAEDVKAALRRRHPAIDAFGSPGPWVCLEELWNIDLLACSAWSRPPNGLSGVTYPRIGYEVKVSRGDYRQELLRPHKRAASVARCHAFYFAVPKGLIGAGEIEWDVPAWRPEDYVRQVCPAGCRKVRKRKGSGQWGPWPDWRATGHSDREWIVCATCGGKGYIGTSLVERQAPTLWVPRDVGLIEVSDKGASMIVRKAPVWKRPLPITHDHALHEALRWASFRPDVRHRSRGV